MAIKTQHGTLDFEATEERARKMTVTALRYTINDVIATLDITNRAFREDGIDMDPKGIYADEMNVYAAELNRRLNIHPRIQLKPLTQ